MKKYILLPEHKARFAEWRDKWIANAMSTKAINDSERATVRKAIAGMYRAAGMEPPPDHRIVFVPSPFVARFAAGFASWIWYTRSATDVATDVATREATDEATDEATRVATREATDVATRVATREATRVATDAATDVATDEATREATDVATGVATDVATGVAKWFRLGGCQSDDISRLAEELFPGHRRAMLECAYKAWRMLNGGNQWSGWVAYLSFFRHVVKLPIDYDKWKHYEKAAEHSGPRYIHAKFCIVSDRPEILLVDERNRPHCMTGPFCRWRDGSALYAVHGVRVPWTVVEYRDRITVDQIDKEQNVEVRRVMLELYGEARYLQDSGARPIHADKYGVLYRKEVPGDEPIVMVRVENSTPEADGKTKKIYWLRVPPTIETAREACAWTFGVESKDYRPIMES